MGTTPKWDRGAHLELSTDEKLDYLYSRDDAQQDEIDANKVKVTPATYPEGTETYNIATIKVGNNTKTLKGKVSGGGSGLPDVTSDDNGDVLTVVDGAWAKAAPSGGVFQITDTYDSGEETHTLNKTWQEIYTAFTSGYTCYIIYEDAGGITGSTDYLMVAGVTSYPGGYAVSDAVNLYTANAASDYPTAS